MTYSTRLRERTKGDSRHHTLVRDTKPSLAKRKCTSHMNSSIITDKTHDTNFTPSKSAAVSSYYEMGSISLMKMETERARSQ